MNFHCSESRYIVASIPASYSEDLTFEHRSVSRYSNKTTWVPPSLTSNGYLNSLPVCEAEN